MGKIQCVSTKVNDDLWTTLEKRMETKQTPIDTKIYEEYNKLKNNLTKVNILLQRSNAQRQMEKFSVIFQIRLG
jgi:hypothetical protein